MPVIRSDAHVEDGSGNHEELAFSYASFEDVVKAMDHLRQLGAALGYYFRTARGEESYNLGLDRRAGSPRLRADNVPTGVAQDYACTTREAPTFQMGRAVTRFRVRTGLVEGQRVPLPFTNCSGSTMNAMAKVLAGKPNGAAGQVLPQLTEGYLPKRFNDFWNIVVLDAADIDSAAKKEAWGQGSARAIQAFNLGVQVDPLQMLRGDAIQLGSSANNPLAGHSVFCFATRRVRAGEVRFVFLSSQIDTFGIGVRLNDLARRGILLEGAPADAPPTQFKAALVDEDGEPLANHRYRLQAGTRIIVGTSDDSGRVVAEVPGDVEVGTLSFWLDEDECITWDLRFRRGSEEEEGDEDELEHVARQEWVVSHGSAPYQSYVYHPGSLFSREFVTHAYRYGGWQVLTAGEEDRHTLFTPWRGHPHVARVFHEFPRYPIALGGSTDLDYVGPDGPVSVEQTTRRYYRNTEALPGGYFPIGRSRLWHGGIHLVPDGEDKTVYAPFEGRVVAARLADPAMVDEEGQPLFPFGSGNFVLLKHRLEVEGTEHTFFSLFMHLADPGLLLEGGGRLLSERAARLPWLREIALAPDRPEDVDEAADLDWRGLYLKVFRLPAEGYKLGDADLAPGDLLEVAGPAVTEGQWRTWNGRAGQVKRVRDGAEGVLDAGDLQDKGGLVAPYDAFPTKHVELKEKLLKGEVVDLWAEELVVRCGEPIGVVGEAHGEEKLHVELFSADLIPMKVETPGEDGAEPTWTAKEAADVDTAGDVQVFRDRAGFLEQFFTAVEEKANEAAGLDGEQQALRIRDRMTGDTVNAEDGAVLKESELQAFFNDAGNSLLPVFRNLVVRHLSEWGSKAEWESYGDAKEFYGDWLEQALSEVGKKHARYVWWTDGFGEEAGLPSDQVAHYYHPITFLRWLEHERLQELPKGAADALHQSVVELNHLIEGPEAADGDEQEATGRKVRFRLRDEDGDPLEGNRYELEVLGETYSGESGPGGLIEHEVPAEATEGELTFWIDDEERHTWPIQIQ